jgi:hypothetical protein
LVEFRLRRLRLIRITCFCSCRPLSGWISMEFGASNPWGWETFSVVKVRLAPHSNMAAVTLKVFRRKRSRGCNFLPNSAKFCGSILCGRVQVKFENEANLTIQYGRPGTSCFPFFAVAAQILSDLHKILWVHPLWKVRG